MITVTMKQADGVALTGKGHDLMDAFGELKVALANNLVKNGMPSMEEAEEQLDVDPFELMEFYVTECGCTFVIE